MDRKLTLNDGTELDGEVVETESRIFFYVWGLTMASVFELMNDPEKTERIKWVRYGETFYYNGYNHLASVSEETGGMIAGSLRKV